MTRQSTLLLAVLACLVLPLPAVAGWLGVTVTELEGKAVVRVDEVVPGGPADQAGLRVGDQVVSFGGKPVTGCGVLAAAVQKVEPGTRVTVAVRRDGRDMAIPVSMAAWPEGKAKPGVTVISPPNLPIGVPPDWSTKLKRGFLGVRLIPVSEGLGSYFNVDGGVLVAEVVSESPAEKAGLRAGDVLLAVAEKKVSDPSEVGQEIRHRGKGDRVSLDIVRAGRNLTLWAELAEADAEALVLSPSAGNRWVGGTHIDPEAYADAYRHYRDALDLHIDSREVDSAELRKKLEQMEKTMALLAEDPALRAMLQQRSQELQRLLGERSHLEKRKQEEILKKLQYEQEVRAKKLQAMDEMLQARQRELEIREKELEELEAKLRALREAQGNE
jgi:hypothetical protein